MLKEIRREIRNTCTERHHARGQFINVGCMMPWMNYTPRTLDQIIDGDNKAYAQEEAERYCLTATTLMMMRLMHSWTAHCHMLQQVHVQTP